MQPDREVLLPGRQALLQERLLPVSTYFPGVPLLFLPRRPFPASYGSEVSVAAAAELGAAFGEGSQVPRRPPLRQLARWGPETQLCSRPGNCGYRLGCTCVGR